MAKLFPPYIEGVLPAFYADNKGAVVLTVPFVMNRGVSPLQVSEFALKIKTVQSNTYFNTVMSSAYDPDYTEVNFALEQSLIDKLKIGQYYKVQLAYVDETKEIGQYSTVGIIKYTTRPTVEISGLQKNVVNYHIHDYTGICKQDRENGDITERVYSYQFNFYDKDKNVIYTSGELLHNSSYDVDISETYDKFSIPFDINMNERYYISYSITTQNGIELSTPLYAVTNKESIDFLLDADLEGSLNFDNGYISLNLVGKLDENNHEKSATGMFLISRTNEDTNFSIWEDLYRFELKNEKPTRQVWQDFTVEQGKQYQYSIQQYNVNGIYSNRLLSNQIYADFEDMFLYDGERQLKIRFNPKVSSFKTTILEAKIDTIGSKYPFIFRNGRVAYKEFPIAGLISRLMDEENLFLKWDNSTKEHRDETNISTMQDKVSIYGYHEVTTLDGIDNIDENGYYYYQDPRGDYVKISNNFIDLASINQSIVGNDIRYNRIKIEQTNRGYIIPASIKKYYASNNSNIIQNNTNLKTDLTDDNISGEREFKLEVLDWLNNGKPKVFRSPTEGNYIVRLMNISLTPEDRLGRMLHNFSCTAYEINDFSYINLLENNFINKEGLTLNSSNVYFETKQLFGKRKDGTYGFTYEVDNDGNSRNINDYPMLSLLITDATPGDQYRLDIGTNPVFITIGQTGMYEINNKDIVINGVRPLKNGMFGSITYSYYVSPKTNFDKISNISINDFSCESFIGENNINTKLSYFIHNNIEIENPKIEIKKFYFLQVSKRDVQEINNLQDIKKDPNVIYYYVNNNDNNNSNKYYDGYNNNISYDNYDPSFYYNEEKISLQDRTFFNLTIPISETKIPNIIAKNGVIVTVGYQSLNTTLDIEDTDETLKALYEVYSTALKKLNDFISSDNFIEYYYMSKDKIIENQEKYNNIINDYNDKVELVKTTYNNYLYALATSDQSNN